MLCVNTSKARIDGKDINVPAPPEVPACAGEWGFGGLLGYIVGGDDTKRNRVFKY